MSLVQERPDTELPSERALDDVLAEYLIDHAGEDTKDMGLVPIETKLEKDPQDKTQSNPPFVTQSI